MLTVFPIQSKDTQKELCEICNVKFNIASFAYRADDGDFIGICQFRFENNVGYIENLCYAPNVEDSEAMIIMLRATMSFMHRCGIGISIMEENATTDELLKLSGYRKNENEQYYIDLNKFYGSSCSER